MNRIAVLSVRKDKKLFGPSLELNVCGDHGEVSEKNNLHSLRKVRKHFAGEKVLIKSGDEQNRIFAGNLLSFNSFSYKRLLPVINEICRQTAAKYNLKIPFGDLYITASPLIAEKLIAALQGMSRIFSVISEEELPGSIYDELYFKHGTLIRQLPDFNSDIPEDSLIIRCNSDSIPGDLKIPVVDLSPQPLCCYNAVNVSRILIRDISIDVYEKTWGGKSGIHMYELLDLYPTDKSSVDINKKSDEIFLLDMEQI